MAYSQDALVQTITFKAENKASATFEQLGRASEKLGRQLKTSAESVGEAAGAWDKLEASAGKLSSALNGLSPSVGILRDLRTQMSSMATTAGRLSERLDKLAISSAAFADLGNDATKGQRLLTTATDHMMSDFARIKGELTGLKTDKITLGSQMQEQAKLMSEAARSMEVSAGKMRSAERASSSGGGTSSGGRGSGSPFHSRNFAGRVAIGTAGAMGVYAGIGEAVGVIGGSDYRGYTAQATQISAQTGAQGQAIAYGVNPQTGRPNPIGSVSGGLSAQYLRTAPRYGLRPTEAMAGYYNIASSVTDPRQAAALNEAAMMSAGAGGVPLTQTADFLVQLNNSYRQRMRGRQGTMSVANSANEAVMAGNMTWAQLPQMMGRSIGMASDIGITPEQLLAMTSMLSTRRNPGEVSPLLTNFTRSLQAPRPMQMRTAQELGLDWHKVQADLKNHDLMGAMGLINAAVSQGPLTADQIEQNTHGMVTGKAAVNQSINLGTTRQRERALFGGQSQAMQTFDTLFAGANGARFQTDFLNRIAGPQSAGSAQRSLNTREQDPTFRFNKMLGQIEAFKVKLEAAFEGVREKIEKALGGALDGLIKDGPKIKAFFTGIGDAVGPVASAIKTTLGGAFGGFFGELGKHKQEILSIGSDIKKALAPVGQDFVSLGSNIKKALEPIGGILSSMFSGGGRSGAGGVGKSLADGIILALKGVVVYAKVWNKEVDTEFQVVAAGIEIVKKAVSAFSAWFKSAFGAISEVLQSQSKHWEGIGDSLKGTWNEVKQTFTQAFSEIKKSLAEVLAPFQSLETNQKGGADKGKELALVIGTTLVVAAAALTIALRTVVDILKLVVDALVGVIKIGIDVVTYLVKMGLDIKKVFEGLGQLADDLISGHWSKLPKDVAAIFGDILKICSDTWDSVDKIIADFASTIGAIIHDAVNAILNPFKQLYDDLVGHSIVPDLIKAIVQAFKDLPGKLAGSLADLVKGIKDAFTGMVGKAKDWGGNIIGSLASGITSGAEKLKNAFTSAVHGAFTTAQSWLNGHVLHMSTGTAKDVTSVNGTGLLATTSSGGGLGPGLGRATLGKNAPFVDSGSELGNYAMFQANKIKYSGALLDYDYGTAPHKVSLPRGSYTYGGQYSLKGMGTFEWFNTQNGGVIGFNHLQSTPNYKPGQHLSGGAKVGISGEPTSPQFGSGYHLCIVTDAKGREYFQWLSTEQMNNVVKAGGGISSRVAGYSSMIQKASKQTGAPVDLLAAIMQTESGGDPTQISPAGALGLMQIMPGNLGHLGVKNWRNAQQNITGGAKLLMEYYRQSGGDWNQALKWYNAGYAHPEKGAGYAKTVLALAHNVGFHGGAGTDPTSFGGKYNAPPPGGWAYGVVGATFEGQHPYSTALDYGPFPVGQPGRTALQHNPMAALAYSRYMGRIENLPTEFQGYLAPQAQKFRDALVAEDRDYTKKRDQRIGQYNKELAGIKQRFGDKRADLLTNEQQAIVYKIAGTDITTDARKKKELQQVISARAAYNTRIANLNAEEQAAKRGDYTKSERDADTDKYKRLRTQATTAFNRKTAGYETDLFGQDQVSKDRLNLYLSHLGVRTTTQGQRISRAEAEAKKALEDKYFGTTGKPGLITALTEGHMGKVAQITQDINKASNPAQIIADLTKDIADKLKKGMDSIVYKLLAGSDGIGKFVKQVADATVAQTKMQNLNDRASMAVEERLAKDKDYTRVLAENARIQARVNLAKQKESDNVLATNLNHESYIKTLAASAMEQQRNTLLQAKQNLAVTQITANSEKYTKSLYETQLANQLSAQLQAKQNVAVTQMTASSDQFTKSLYQTQIANQASAQLQAAQNLVVAQMLAGSTAYTQSLIEMRTIDEANAQLQSATSLRVSTAFTDLAGMAQSVGDILNANIGKWTDSVGKGAGYLNTYTSGLKAAYDEQVALTDADNKRNVILGQVLGDFQRLSSGLQGVFSTSMEKISLWTAMLGRSADGITTTTGDIVKLGVQALKDAGNLASLDDVIAGISSVVSGLKSAAGTDFMRTGSIGAGTIGAYSAAQTSLTQANWDQVATDLTLSRSDKDLPGYMEAVGREIEMWKNKTARDAATFGQHSTQVQQDLDVLKKLQDEAHGLDIAFKRLTDTTLKAPVAPTDPTDTAAFKTYQEDLQAWNDDTAAADAAMVAFASGGVTAAESALQGMTAIINTSATNLSGSLATASSGASSLATTTVTLANAFTSLTSAVAGLLAAINAKGSGSLGGGGGIENAAPGQRQGQGTNGGHTFSVYRDPDTGQTSYVWDDGQVTNSGVYPGARANPYSDGTTPPPADTTSSAYQAGYRAGTIGPSAGLNPYASGTPENQQWNLGMYAGVGSGQHTSVGTDGTTPPPANINSVAYQQGYQAGQTGTGSNPYPPGSDNNRQWNQGMYAGVGAGPAPPPPALVTPPAVIPGAVPIGGPSSALTQGIAQSESMYAPVSGMPGLYYMHADPKNPDQGVYVYTSSNGTQTFYTGDKYKPGTTPKITGNYDISANLGSTDGGGSVGSGATPSAFMSASSDIMGPAWTRQYYGGNTFDPFGNSLDPKVQGGGFGGGGGEVELTATGGPSIMRGTTTTFKPDPYNGDYGVYRYNPLGASFDTSATFDNQDPLYGTMGGIRPASMGGAGFYDSLMKSNVLGILGSTPGGSEIADALKAIAQTSEQTASNTGDIASNISNMDPAEVAKQLRSLLTQVREYEATHGRSIPGLATMGWDEFSRKAGAIATQAGI